MSKINCAKMEKEEKIAKQQKLAAEMSFFGRIRAYYPAFAVFYVSVIRLLLWYTIGVSTKACSFIFMTQCLVLYNMPVNMLVTFVTQTLVSNLIERGAVWPVPQEVLVFHALFTGLLGVSYFGLNKAFVKSKKDKDPVFGYIASSCLIFGILCSVMPEGIQSPGPIGADDSPASFIGTVLFTFFQTICVTFATGPIKVWLDVKGGKTSLKEMQDDYIDERTWLHKKMGADGRAGLLPNRNQSGPTRRQRENTSTSRDQVFAD